MERDYMSLDSTELILQRDPVPTNYFMNKSNINKIPI